MKPVIRLGLVLGLGGCLWLVAEESDPAQARYGPILDRNPFSLQDPPPPPPPAAPPEQPAVKLDLQLAGISVGPDGPVAWLVIPPKPGQNTNTLYWKLKEWREDRPEQQGDIKVLAIDLDQRTVKVENAGTVAVLDLTKDSPQPTGPAAVANAPGVRRVGGPQAPGVKPGVSGTTAPGGRNVAPGVRRVNAPGNPNQSRVTPSVQRVGGTSFGGGGEAALVGADGSPMGVVNANRVVPARPLRTANDQMPVNQDPAVQWLMMRAQEEAAAAQGVPLPPTPSMPGQPQ